MRLNSRVCVPCAGKLDITDGNAGNTGCPTQQQLSHRGAQYDDVHWLPVCGSQLQSNHVGAAERVRAMEWRQSYCVSHWQQHFHSVGCFECLCSIPFLMIICASFVHRRDAFTCDEPNSGHVDDNVDASHFLSIVTINKNVRMYCAYTCPCFQHAKTPQFRSPSSFAWPTTNANVDLNVFLDHNHITSLDSTQYVEEPVGTTTATPAPTPSSQPCRNQQGPSTTYTCICTGTRLVLRK